MTEVLVRGLGVALLFAAAGCSKGERGGFELRRLGEARDFSMVDVAGEARPARLAAAHEAITFDLELPREPCWLDVEAAEVGEVDPAGPFRGVLLDVAWMAARGSETLLHAIPSAGTKPTALGWGHARVEIVDHLGERVKLEFRIGATPGDEEPAATRRFALSRPRLSPRVDASARPWALIDWLGAGPSVDELDREGGAKLWPGHARVGAAVDAFEVRRANPGSGARPSLAAGNEAGETELVAFGAENAADIQEAARRRCDRLARPDPFVRDADDAALAALAKLDAAVRTDRARALGERTLDLELARPRRGALCVEVTSLRDAATCDAALLRLLEYLAATEMLDRTLLVVRTRPTAAGRGLVVARLPRGWQSRAPRSLLECFAQRAPEFASH